MTDEVLPTNPIVLDTIKSVALVVPVTPIFDTVIVPAISEVLLTVWTSPLTVIPEETTCETTSPTL